MSLESWTYGRASRGEGEIKKQKRDPEKEIVLPKLCGPGSKSNTGAGEIDIKNACPKVVKLDHKNEDISESVNSIDSGAIFPSRSGQDLSRNAFVVSVYAL